MTPDKCKEKLKPLRPAVLKPSNTSPSSVALQELEEVHSIQISHFSEREHNARYAVEVSTGSPRSELVTTTSSVRSTDSDRSANRAAIFPRSTVRVERELQDFVYLHERVFSIVRWAHPARHCNFCLKMAVLLAFGANPDGLLLRFLGRKWIARRLTKFVADVVVLTAQCTSLSGRVICPGQALVVQVVYDFLFTPTQG